MTDRIDGRFVNAFHLWDFPLAFPDIRLEAISLIYFLLLRLPNRNVFNPMATCVISCWMTFVQTSQWEKTFVPFHLLAYDNCNSALVHLQSPLKQVTRGFFCTFVTPHAANTRPKLRPLLFSATPTRAQFPLGNNILGWCKDHANLIRIAPTHT